MYVEQNGQRGSNFQLSRGVCFLSPHNDYFEVRLVTCPWSWIDISSI